MKLLDRYGKILLLNIKNIFNNKIVYNETIITIVAKK